MINKEELKSKAKTLESLLELYALSDASARQCMNLLAPLIRQSIEKKIDLPVNDVPCAYTFHEGELRQFSDLEEAYSSFCVAARGLNTSEGRRRMMAEFPDLDWT